MTEDTRAVTISPPETRAVESVSVAQVAKQLDMIRELMHRVMVPGRHYGVIPGCGDKPTLLKPGAELLGVLFQLRPEFAHTVHELPGGHREVVSTCTLYTRSAPSRAVGGGTGSCSTMESKYRYRKGERVCPKCGKSAIMKSKYPPKDKSKGTEPGWYCYGKRGGCGAEFAANDVAITEQQTGRIENPDPADQWNTVAKMADKRAYVAAMLFATGASDYFTQDLEDLPEHAGNIDSYSSDMDSDHQQESHAAPREPGDDDEPPPPDDPDAHTQTAPSRRPAHDNATEKPPSDKLVALKDRLAEANTVSQLSAVYRDMLVAKLTESEQKEFRMAYAARQKALGGSR